MKSLIMIGVLASLMACSSSPHYVKLEPYTSYTIHDRYKKTDVLRFTTREIGELNYGHRTASKKNTGNLIVSQNYLGFGFRYQLSLTGIYEVNEHGEIANSTVVMDYLTNNKKFEEKKNNRMKHYHKVINSKYADTINASPYRFTIDYQPSVAQKFGFTCNKLVHVKENVIYNHALPPERQHPVSRYEYSYYCPLLANSHTWVLNTKTEVTIDRKVLINTYGPNNLPSDENILTVVQRELKPLVDSIQFLIPITQQVPEDLEWVPYIPFEEVQWKKN